MFPDEGEGCRVEGGARFASRRVGGARGALGPLVKPLEGNSGLDPEDDSRGGSKPDQYDARVENKTYLHQPSLPSSQAPP